MSATGNDGDLESSEGVISGNGRLVAFSSLATNLITGDGNKMRDVLVRVLVARTTVRASVSSTDTEADQDSFTPSLSRDGRFVSFLSDASSLVSPQTFFTQLYVRDRSGPTTTRVSQPAAWGQLSGDGRYATVYDFFSSVSIVDRFAARSLDLSNGADWRWPVLSGNGRYIAIIETLRGRTQITVAPNPL